IFSFFFLFFFFSSRRRHTRSLRDWSSDVCSSDLRGHGNGSSPFAFRVGLDSSVLMKTSKTAVDENARFMRGMLVEYDPFACGFRSEERRVGKECRSRWSRYHEKKKRK